MKGLLLFLLFALLAVEFGFGSVTLELKRHETKREMLLRTGEFLLFLIQPGVFLS
jgi:hypothetical protein